MSVVLSNGHIVHRYAFGWKGVEMGYLIPKGKGKYSVETNYENTMTNRARAPFVGAKNQKAILRVIDKELIVDKNRAGRRLLYPDWCKTFDDEVYWGTKVLFNVQKSHGAFFVEEVTV